MLKAVVFNLGCKVNQYECDVLASELSARGYQTSEDLEYADLYVINTCAVTNEAERKSRQIISRIKALNSEAEIIITGCASQKNKNFYETKNLKYISGVAGKQKIFDEIDRGISLGDFTYSNLYEEPNALPQANRTRAYVKIQDGCNNFCSYCIIPYLRGRSRSRKIDACVEEIKRLSSNTMEVVITGVNLAQYGVDTGESLAELIRNLKEVKVRLRLGSFYVEGINDELLDALSELHDFCPHFHLSLQHGDDSVLKSMNRHYGVKEYQEKVALIRKYFPLAAITTDIIVGYPTETDEAFENMLSFVKDIKFSDIHIFPFSPREGTKAYTLKRIPAEIVKNRKNILKQIKDDLHEKYLNLLQLHPQNTIFETEENGISVGYSQYYLRIYARTQEKRAIIYPLTKFKDGLIGEIYHE